MPEIVRSGLTFYMHDGLAAFRFQLAGELTEDSTADIDQARQTASSVFTGRPLIVDLTGIEKIDTAGRELLKKWHSIGAQLVVTTLQAKARIQPMTGIPVNSWKQNSGAKWLSGRAVVSFLAAVFGFLSIPFMERRRW